MSRPRRKKQINKLVRDAIAAKGMTEKEFSLAICGAASSLRYRFRCPGSWRVEELAYMSRMLDWTEADVGAFLEAFFFDTEM